MKAAKRGNSKSGRSERAGRDDREERGERGRGGKGGRSGGNNNTMMIGLGVAGLVLVIICIAALSGNKAPDPKKAPVVNEVLTNASEYAEKARKLEASGDRLGAAEYYGKAAEAAGSDDAAQRYNMHAYELRKFTTLNMSHK
jgi:hypothetical protein